MSTGNASISVVVPTYNCGAFIAEAIDSILAQTRVPDQIIVVDDGSTDDTEQVVGRYPQVEYIGQRNGGVSAARNTGLDAARGEFVTFLDADDRWRPAFVERLHGLLATEPTAVFAFANFVRFEHPSGKMLKEQFVYYPELRGVPHRIESPAAFATLIGCGEFPAFTQVMMFRRDALDGLRFDPTLKFCEDAHFVLRAAMHGSVLFTNEVLAEVRRHDSNSSRDVGEMSVYKLRSIQALEPYVSGANLGPYHDRLVKAHIDAAIYRVKSGFQHYRDGLKVPGSRRRKLKALVRMVLAPLL